MQRQRGHGFGPQVPSPIRRAVIRSFNDEIAVSGHEFNEEAQETAPGARLNPLR